MSFVKHVLNLSYDGGRQKGKRRVVYVIKEDDNGKLYCWDFTYGGFRQFFKDKLVCPMKIDGDKFFKVSTKSLPKKTISTLVENYEEEGLAAFVDGDDVIVVNLEDLKNPFASVSVANGIEITSGENVYTIYDDCIFFTNDKSEEYKSLDEFKALVAKFS
jgi:hypothetical protein